MWRLSRLRIFRKSNVIDITIFEASVTRFRYCIALEGPAIGAGGHRMGFTPRESDHTECGNVYISANLIMLSAEEFTSSTPNIAAKNLNQTDIKFFIKKLNREEIATIVTSLEGNVRRPCCMLPPGESWWVWTTGQMDGFQTVSLRYPLDASSTITTTSTTKQSFYDHHAGEVVMK